MRTQNDSRSLVVVVGCIAVLALAMALWPRPPAESDITAVVDGGAPKVDPDPALTERIVRGLYANYEGITTLRFTTRVEFDPPIPEGNATFTTWVAFDGPPEYTTTADNAGSPRPFRGRARIEFRSGEGDYDMVIADGRASVVMTGEAGENRETVPAEDVGYLHTAFDTIFFNHFSGAGPGDGGYVLRSKRCDVTVDESTGDIAAIAARFNGKPFLEERVIEYQETEGGFRFPKTIDVVSYQNGDTSRKRTMTYRIEDVVVNAPLDDSLFTAGP